MMPIIPVSDANCQVNSWKNLLKNALTCPRELLASVGLTPAQLDFEIADSQSFKMRVPQPFIDKMQFGDPRDPLLLQVLSQAEEDITVAGYQADPLAETNSQQAGLLHKYHGRVLLILASACAVNCRYCFRRHFPYQEQQANGTQLAAAIEYIKATPSISEVILSGGDPLVLGDNAIGQLVKQLDNIPHLRRLRFHTRLPVVIPQRVTRALCKILKSSRLNASIVLHINHANEIDPLLHDACQQLLAANVRLYNQSVLLKNINDNSETLINLSEKLFDSGITPYYLHLLDKVQGAAHFDINADRAIDLVEQMRNHLPGYLVPRLARETPQQPAKTVIA